MLTLNVTPFVLAIFPLIADFQIVQSMAHRDSYRITYRGRTTPPFAPLLSIIPPRSQSPQNFNSDYLDSKDNTKYYDSPPFMMSSQPPLNYDPEPNMHLEYGPPPPPLMPPMKPLIQKHIYVHVPPPEPDVQPSRPPITAAPPQKHYKIVFIKAPSVATPTLPTIPVQLPDEEKTLVYVLVKKPDDLPELVIPKPPSTTPSKPEVYFIRYKAQTEQSNNNNGPYPYPPSNNQYSTTSITLGPPLAPLGQYSSNKQSSSKNNRYSPL